MLQFLQTGKALYVLAVVCGLGMISKLMTSSLYKRLVKETGNMALTKNKNLRSLKQKTENAFLLNHGIRNASAYIEKQLYGFRFMKISLDVWDNVSMQAMILCFLVGGIAAFGAYWYRCDSYYIVLYGTMGILSGLFLVLVDNGANISLKRQQLADALVDYVENSPHFYRAGSAAGQAERRWAGSTVEQAEHRWVGSAVEQKERLRGIGKHRRTVMDEIEKTGNGDHEAAAADAMNMSGVVRMDAAEKEDHGNEKKRSEKHVPRLSRRLRRKALVAKNGIKMEEGAVGNMREHDGGSGQNGRGMTAVAGIMEPKNMDGKRIQEEELAQSIDSLKQSLDQIAACREQARRELQVVKSSEQERVERARKELSAEDLKFLGELLQEYLT